MKRELTIAGGGLAGLSLAAGLARRGLPVTVVEAGRYPRHRVCGEFISGASERTLGALGIEDLLADARRHWRVRWCSRGRVFYEGELPKPALGLSRYELDERLRQRVQERGGTVRTGERLAAEGREGLVWAAGRRRVAGAGRWVGLKVHARLEEMMRADLEMRGGANGYTGLARVEEGWVNVCGLFWAPRGGKTAARELLPTLIEEGGDRELAAALRSVPLREGSFSAVAGFDFGRQAAPPGWAAIGDAESLIPPFTGHGMAMAFMAAECALEPMAGWCEWRVSWQEAVETLRLALRRRFARRLFFARLLHPFLLGGAGGAVLSAGGALGLLPFRLLYSLVR